MSRVTEAIKEKPFIAILRGIQPREIVAIADMIYLAGIRAIEVTLDSPDPLKSIRILTDHLGDRAACGAGTVLSTEDVDAAGQSGATFMVAPNTNPAVIRKCIDQKIEPLPGIATATEAFLAVEAGATYLKLFPASTYGPQHMQALAAILPERCRFVAVGGIGKDSTAEWFEAGAAAIGLGSFLYSPGMAAEKVYSRATHIAGTVPNR